MHIVFLAIFLRSWQIGRRNERKGRN